MLMTKLRSIVRPKLVFCGDVMSRSIAALLISAGIFFFCARAHAQTPKADALIAEADNLAKQGHYSAAAKSAQKALALLEQAFGPNDPRLVAVLKEVARFFELEERYEESEAAYKRALALVEWLPKSDSVEIAGLKAKIAVVEAKRTRAGGSVHTAGAAHRNESLAGEVRRSFAPQPPMPSPSGAAPAPTSVALPPPEVPIPQFPWPPPPPSARYEFPQDTFNRYSTVGEVSSAILKALESSGYVERSFFRTGDGGVALVTRLEKIGNDGFPAAEVERWPAGFDDNPASFVDFVRGLFFAKAGRYRVIVFVLQEAYFTQSHETATGQMAEDWLRGGANKLPPALADRPFGKNSTATALIYEFASDGSAVKEVVSSLTGKQHLQRAGLLAALEKAQ